VALMDSAAAPVEPFRTLSELELLAAKRVLDHVWTYIEGGSGEERTLEANRTAFRRWNLLPRALVDVTSVDLRTTVLGRTQSAPFFVAPMAYNGQVHPDGEIGVARAASRANVLAAYSTLSTNSLEEIAQASGDVARWFQLYLQPDFAVSRSLVERAEKARYSAILLTVDVPVLGVRDRQALGGFAIDETVPIGNGSDVLPPCRAPVLQGPVYRLRSEAASTWNVLDQIRSITSLPLVVKGVLTREDARRAVEHGAKGVVVSNHGGRQLDAAPATLDVLPDVVDEIGGEVEVYMDGGARRASDILIALALGAKCVGLGRPVLWALAVGGKEGVRRLLSLLAEELATSMAIAGRRSISEIDRTLVVATHA
jgi:4-hydroxymandelate oxidase